MAKEHLRSHTGLRGIAALMVAPVHMYCDEFVNGFDRAVLPFLNSVLAVDVFFVLSGFILPFVYHDSGGNMNASWRKFFSARFARIYPLHLLTIAIVGVMVLMANARGIPMGRPYYVADLPSQLLLVHAFPYIEKWAWIHPSWSISMEFLAYVAIFPVMTLAFRGSRPLATKTAIILGFCGLYGFTYWICAASGGNAAMGWYAVGRICAGFGIGFLLFKIHQQHPAVSLRIQRHCDLILMLFLAAYAASCFKLFAFQWLILLIPLLVLALTSNDTSFASRIFGNRVMVWLGTISYSVYMIHTIFGKIVVGLSNKLPPPSPIVGLLMLGGVFASLLLVASLSYWLFENPTRKWLAGKLEKRPQTPFPSTGLDAS
jgi:peptidoglycan/LPS O-acetylase OafA/YrhL